MKLSRSILAFALLVPMAACGGDDDGTGPDTASLVGTWTVTSTDGMSLPITETTEITDEISCTFTLSAMEVTFTAAGAYNGHDTSSVQCTGEAAEDLSSTFSGTYSISGDRVTLTYQDEYEGTVSEVNRFAVSGSTLTIFDGTTGSATAIVAVKK